MNRIKRNRGGEEQQGAGDQGEDSPSVFHYGGKAQKTAAQEPVLKQNNQRIGDCQKDQVNRDTIPQVCVYKSNR